MKFFPLFSLVVATILISCVQLEKIKDGDTAYERKRYAQAVELYQKEIGRVGTEEDLARMAYRLGESYRNIGDFRNAAKWYKDAYEAGCTERCLEKFADMMKSLQQYEQALRAYEVLSARSQRGQYLGKIADIKNAMLWQRGQPSLELVSSEHNSAFTEYPTYLDDQGNLVISYDKAAESSKETYYWTGNSFFDIGYIDAKDENDLPNPYFKFDGHQADWIVTDDFAFFTRCTESEGEYDIYCQIWVSYLEGGFWTKPEPLPFQRSARNYRHPSYSPQTRTLYFSANLEQDTTDQNIYQTTYQGEKNWSDPLLAPGANSTGREVFPRIYGDTLYFSSDIAGMGGLDVFYVFKYRDRWTTPVNMRAPINSGGDDFALTLNTSKSGDTSVLGYVASSRYGGIGKDDIYSFKAKELLDRKEKDEDPTEIDSVIVKITTQERIFNIADDPNSGLKYRQPLTETTLDLEYFPGESAKVNVDEFGSYALELIPNTALSARASKSGYLASSLDMIVPSRDTAVSIVLDKILYNTEIVLQNIFFDFDKWDIRPDAEPTLNALIRILRDNPDIQIELSSHTDCRGTSGYNQDLSARRAYSSIQYLINNGIDAERLVSRGYGESQPRVDCECDDCTEREHQLNRRTSFTILQ